MIDAVHAASSHADQYIMDPPQTAPGTLFIGTPGIQMDVTGPPEASQVSTSSLDSLNSHIALGAGTPASLQASQIVRDFHFLRGRTMPIERFYMVWHKDPQSLVSWACPQVHGNKMVPPIFQIRHSLGLGRILWHCQVH